MKIEVEPRNALGGELKPCCVSPPTGYYRDGYCRVDVLDPGIHAVCAVMTEAFLEYSFDRGNDLMSARPEAGFAGLRPGDRWCLCAARWAEALSAGVAPPLLLEATHEAILEYVGLEELRVFAWVKGKSYSGLS